MLKALMRTTTEILDSKKAAYSFLAATIAIVLHLRFGVSPADALLLVSPLGLATAAQAHVDAKRGATNAPTTSTADTATETATPSTPPPASTQPSSSQG
jgi:hypothetical protein